MRSGARLALVFLGLLEGRPSADGYASWIGIQLCAQRVCGKRDTREPRSHPAIHGTRNAPRASIIDESNLLKVISG